MSWRNRDKCPEPAARRGVRPYGVGVSRTGPAHLPGVVFAVLVLVVHLWMLGGGGSPGRDDGGDGEATVAVPAARVVAGPPCALGMSACVTSAPTRWLVDPLLLAVVVAPLLLIPVAAAWAVVDRGQGRSPPSSALSAPVVLRE